MAGLGRSVLAAAIPVDLHANRKTPVGSIQTALRSAFSLFATIVCTALRASGSDAAPSKVAPPGGLVIPPIQRLVADATAVNGRLVECVDIRTGSAFQYRAQHLLPSGAIDESWTPDTSQCCLGSPEGIRERVVADGAGGSYAAWIDSRLEEPDIYLQRFTACGDTVSGWLRGGRAVCAAPRSQYNLDVCSDGQGGVLLAWQDFRSGLGSAVYLQRITESGEPASAWQAGGMVPAPGGREQAVPRVAADGTGGALVFWQERDEGGLGLRVQRVGADGAIASGWPVSGVLLVSGSQHVASVSARDDANGRVVVVWSHAADASGATLHVAHLDIGPVPGTEWAANATALSAAGLLSDAVVSSAADGGLFVAWAEMGGGQTVVRLVRLAEGGAVAAGWPQSGALVASTSASLTPPTVLADGDGGAIVAWEDWRSTGNGEIYAQRVLPDGTLDSLWAAGGVPVATGSPPKYAPVLASDGNGGTIITWSEATSEAMAAFLRAQRGLAEGMPQLLRTETNSGYACLVWTIGGAAGARVRSYRALGDGNWEAIEGLSIDDSLHLVLKDHSAPPGSEVEYRLSVATGEAEYFLAPVRLEIPRDPTKLVLERVWSSPGRDALQFAFALPSGPPARVEVFDVLGRQVARASLDQYKPGFYTHRLEFRGRAVSGVYFIRLSQGTQSNSRRVSFLR